MSDQPRETPLNQLTRDPEPFLPADECLTSDMLRKVAGHLRSGALVSKGELDTDEWIAALEDRARRLDEQALTRETPPAPLDLEALKRDLETELPQSLSARVETALDELTAARAEIARLTAERDVTP